MEYEPVGEPAAHQLQKPVQEQQRHPRVIAPRLIVPLPLPVLDRYRPPRLVSPRVAVSAGSARQLNGPRVDIARIARAIRGYVQSERSRLGESR